MISFASISEDALYRYSLYRRWSFPCDYFLWVMLNPSTADHQKDDPTIRRVVKFSQANGAGGCIVVNLYAYRATEPVDLLYADDPVGPRNDEFILKEAARCTKHIVAWGGHKLVKGRNKIVLDMFHSAGYTPLCLGTTRGGDPRHPLYVPGRQALEEY